MSTIKDYKDKKISENWKYVLGDRNEEPSTFDFSNERNIKAKKAKGYADHYRYTDQEGNTAFIVEKQYTDDSQQEKKFILHSKWKNVVNGQQIWIAKKAPEPRNILVGISRNYIIELARELSIKCIETNLTESDVYEADEAFMTATPFCMLPVTKINGRNIGSGKRGKITNELLSLWSEKVGVDIEKQIKEFNYMSRNNVSNGTTPYQFGNSDG